MKKVLRYPVVILLFGLVSLFFIVNLITPAKNFSEMENRYLTQLPKFSVSGLMDSSDKGFARKFEQYANDQFFLRDGWISLKSRCEALLGKKENNGIVYGKDGYMFEKYRSFDEARLEKNLTFLEGFADMNPDLDKYVMVIPGSYNVLDELAPRGLGNVDQFPLINEIGERLAKKSYIAVDAAANLVSHKNEPIYYHTDHHWTTLGAFYGYQSFAEAAGFEAITPADSLKKTENDFFGTYFNKAKKHDSVSDEIVWYELPVDSVVIDGKAKEGMYDFSQFDGRDKYAMFLHANNGVTIIENAAAPEKTVMVIKDSYANCFVPYLTQNYSKVVVIDLRSMPKGLNQLIADEGIEDLLVLYSFSNLASDTNFPRLKY